MAQIRDALELLTAQHEEIDALLEHVTQTRDAAAFVTLATRLTTHLAIEQELLYPVITKYVSLGVLDEMIAEHVTIKRQLVEALRRGLDDPEFASAIDDLARLHAGHSAWQEYELFETAAENLSPDQLSDLCTQLQTFESYAVAA